MKVEVAVLGSLSLTVLMVSVDVKHLERAIHSSGAVRKSRSPFWTPGPYGLCGIKATVKLSGPSLCLPSAWFRIVLCGTACWWGERCPLCGNPDGAFEGGLFQLCLV